MVCNLYESFIAENQSSYKRTHILNVLKVSEDVMSNSVLNSR
jgi:hypothetical protein